MRVKRPVVFNKIIFSGLFLVASFLNISALQELEVII